MSDELINAIADMQEDQVLELTQQLLANGTAPLTILDDCRRAMEIVGKRFEVGEYFLPELVMAGEVLRQVATIIKPLLQQTSQDQKRAKVVLGTVKGDIHDIGKDIVAFMLDVNGFEVHDLGVDVPVQNFVDTIATVKPEIVALSGFLTLAFDSMKATIAAIKEAGLRDSVKIMIGGGAMDENVRVYAGADGYGADAIAAVALAKAWTR
jgi:5-methyltetrahydrofolate--homocysteine methyltransferase